MKLAFLNSQFTQQTNKINRTMSSSLQLVEQPMWQWPCEKDKGHHDAWDFNNTEDLDALVSQLLNHYKSSAEKKDQETITLAPNQIVCTSEQLMRELENTRNMLCIQQAENDRLRTDMHHQHQSALAALDAKNREISALELSLCNSNRAMSALIRHVIEIHKYIPNLGFGAHGETFQEMFVQFTKHTCDKIMEIFHEYTKSVSIGTLASADVR